MTLVVQVLVAAVATLGFSIRFQAPVRQWLCCAMVGGTAWLVRGVLLHVGFSVSLAVFFAAWVLVLLSRLFSAVRKTPATMFLFSGIFPLVPGAGIYYTAYAIFSANAAQAGRYALETLVVAGAIVFGILFGYFVPQVVFNGLAKALGTGRAPAGEPPPQSP